MRNRNSKQLDTVINKLLEEFLKADKVIEDPNMLSLMIKTVKHFGEIQDFKGMYKKYFIPKTKDYISDLRKAIKKSRFRKFITNEFVDLEENKNETIRLALVGLNHKYENFRKDLIRNFNEYLKQKNIDIEIDKFVFENYGFKMRENWKNQSLFELSWICNRIKHDSALPVNFENPNQSIPLKFAQMDKTIKMVFTAADFYEYCDKIYQYCVDLFLLFNEINLRIQFIELDAMKIQNNILDLKILGMIAKLNNRKKN